MYLTMKAAATLRTLGYLHRATIVSRLPARPVIMMMIATTAAKVLRGFGNLRRINQQRRVTILSIVCSLGRNRDTGEI